MIVFIALPIFILVTSVSVVRGGYGVEVTGKLKKDAHPLWTNLNNRHNVEYYGSIYIGTPGTGQDRQKFEVIFDTGSTDLIIMDSNYNKNCQNEEMRRRAMCRKAQVRKYSSDKSTSYERTDGIFSVTYLDTTAFTGHLAYEYIEIGDGPSKARVKAQLGIADSSTNSIGKVDGIFGMGFGVISSFEPHVLTAFEAIFTQTDIPGQMGYYIKKDDDNVDGVYGGEMYFGGYNPEYVVGDLTPPIPVTLRDNLASEWNMAIKSIRVGSRVITLDGNDLDGDGVPGTNSIPDTGSSTIVLPYNIFMNLLEYLFSGEVPNGVSRGTPFLCDELPENLPTITFVINDEVSFDIGPEYYIKSQMDGLVCQLAIIACRCESIVLGCNFIQKYYTVFDFENRQFMFAEAKQAPISVNSRQPGAYGRKRASLYPREDVERMRREAPSGVVGIPRRRFQ